MEYLIDSFIRFIFKLYHIGPIDKTPQLPSNVIEKS